MVQWSTVRPVDRRSIANDSIRDLLFTETHCTFDPEEQASERAGERERKRPRNERIEVSEMRYVRILDLRLLNCYR